MREIKFKVFLLRELKIAQVDTLDTRSGTITYSSSKGINTPCYSGDYIFLENLKLIKE